MKAWELAANWHAKHFPNVDFGDAMAEAIRDGLFYAHADLFVMGREVRWDGQNIADGEPNAWLAHLAVSTRGGNPILQVMDLAPYPHEYCLWMRRNDGRIRAYKWQDLIMKLQGGQ